MFRMKKFQFQGDGEAKQVCRSAASLNKKNQSGDLISLWRMVDEVFMQNVMRFIISEMSI